MTLVSAAAERNTSNATVKGNNSKLTAMHIPFSEKTNELIFELRDFSENGLHNINDLATLIEITTGKDDDESFNKLIFDGKYANGLKKVLDRDVSITDEARQNIYEQFQSAIENLIRTTKSILETQDLEMQSYFETKYLMLTQENLVNLLSLAGDLAICKEYYNSLR